MKNNKIVPWVFFSFIMAGALLFMPVIAIRAGELGELSIPRNFDILFAAMFFVICCVVAIFYGRPRLFLSISIIGLVLVLLSDSNIAVGLMATGQEGLRNAFAVGVVLLILGLFLQFNSGVLFHIILDEATIYNNKNSLLSTHPYIALLIITITILFIEIVLIRYTASQLRIFSFYKNIPLIAAFLGLGLGCFRSKGTKGHLLLFFLLLAPTLALLGQIALFFDDKLSEMAAIASSEFMLGDYLVISASGTARAFAHIYTMTCIVLVFLLIGTLFSYLGRFLGDALEQVARLRGYTGRHLWKPPWDHYIHGVGLRLGATRHLDWARPAGTRFHCPARALDARTGPDRPILHVCRISQYRRDHLVAISENHRDES